MKTQAQKNKEYYKKFPWKRTLVDIKTRCTNKNHIRYYRYGGRGIECKITVDELKILWFRDKACLMDRPSIDREENDGDYCLDNCRYIELSENSHIANQGIKLKPILQFDLKGTFIKEWDSMADAERRLNLSKGGISQCCRKIHKTMYGFIWEYKFDKNRLICYT